MGTSTILLSVAAIWTIAAITPGPNLVVISQTAILKSRSHALVAVIGTVCGTIVWGMAGFFGIDLLFSTAPWLYAALKIVGGAYLVYLGIRSLVRSFRPAPAMTAATSKGGQVAGALRLGLLTNLANPKTAAFVVSLFAATMPPDPPLWLGFAAVLLMVLISLVWYGTVACVFAVPPLGRAYQRARRWIDRAAGAIFVAFGAKLVLER